MLKADHQYPCTHRRIHVLTGARKILDEVGMHCTDADVAPVALPPHWVMDEDADHVQTPSICPTPAGLDSVPQPASREDIVQDAGRFALSYSRDFRALHQFNHDHDCTSTCIKYVAKQCRDAAQDALRKGKVVACRFFFFHILVFTYVSDVLTGMSETITKRIRRGGGESWCHHPTLLSPTNATSFASQSYKEIRLSDQHQQMWARIGVAATSISSSCLEL